MTARVGHWMLNLLTALSFERFDTDPHPFARLTVYQI